ncbi:interferon-inducible GTPase 5-like isoform 1-T1 [Pangshura tecta]
MEKHDGKAREPCRPWSLRHRTTHVAHGKKAPCTATAAGYRAQRWISRGKQQSPALGGCRALRGARWGGREMASTEEASRSIFQDLDVKLPGMSERDVEELKAAIETGNLSEAAQKAQEALELSKNTKLNIAITGESGSGKSSLINAMLGLADDDEGAAEVGITETTTETLAYLHPTLPNVKMWDLPGIGTPSFRPDTYLQQVSFARYDFFIIVTSKRFRSCNADLAQEIQKMGKKFYFVRSKVDEDLRNESRKRNYDQETTLQTIRDDCVEKLRREGVNSPQVFLISRWEFDQYDSPQLQETLANELDSHKRHVFLLALPNISRPILDKKKEALENQIWKRALKSCAIAAVPIPHLSVSCDVDILVESMTEYCKVFGLDEESLVKLSIQVRKPLSQLKGVIKTPLAKEISREEALEQLSKFSGSAMRSYLYEPFKSPKSTRFDWEQVDKNMGEFTINIKKYISILPVCGTLLAAEISLLATFYALYAFLEGVAGDAQRVLTEALEVAEKKSV